jgi:hypothetical protein
MGWIMGNVRRKIRRTRPRKPRISSDEQSRLDKLNLSKVHLLYRTLQGEDEGGVTIREYREPVEFGIPCGGGRWIRRK